MIIKHLLNCSLGIVKVSGNTYHISIGSLLGYHLFLLNRADAMFRIEYDNFGSRYICKTCHGSFTGISGCCGKNYDLIFHMVLLRCCCHQMRKDGKGHILKRNSCAVEQLQKISSTGFMKRSDLFCIKFAVICLADTVLKLFLCKICEKTAHYLICCFLISHLSQFVHWYIQLWNALRHEQSAVLRKAFQYGH